MDPARKNVAVLAVCQGLLLTNNSVLVTVNALAGYALATDKAQATLPVTALPRLRLQGWQAINLAAVPFLLLSGAGMVWLGLHRRTVPKTAS